MTQATGSPLRIRSLRLTETNRYGEAEPKQNDETVGSMMATATVTKFVRARRAVVYDVFADRESYSRFLPLQMRLVQEGVNERQGVGAVHQLGLGPIGVKERITELVPLERISYELIAGAPVRYHIGDVTFADEVDGTRVNYRMDSTPSIPVPGPLLGFVLRGLTSVMVRGAAREARRRAAAS